MRQMFWSFVLTIVMTFCFWIMAVPVAYHPKSYPAHYHKTLYLDRNMSQYELEQIVAATIEWHEATGGIVTFDVKRLPQPDIIPANAILMLHVTPDFPDIIILDNLNQNSTLGLYTHESSIYYIALVADRLTEDDYKSVVLHELGHAVGLEHNEGENGVGTLMYPSIEKGADRITYTDIKKFCKLYRCNPAELYH